MENKIAILTFFKSGNFGGELQAYSLQRKLRDLGYNVEVLHLLRPLNKEFIKTNNFKPIYNPKDKTTKKSKLNRKIYRTVTSIYNFFNPKKHKIRSERFEKFERVDIKLSEKIYYNFDMLYNTKMDYDTFIVGSDQVWNFEYDFSPEPYFLTFAPNNAKKISYAASIGHSSIPEEIKDLYTKWLNEFDYISVRESQGTDIVNDLTNKNAITVLDPTLLLKKEDWIKNFNITNNNNNKYLLIYTLVESEYIFNLASKIAKKLNLKIKRVVPNSITRENYKNVENIFDSGPREFVELFVNASFVLTNSFHGTAFSINLNKPFFAIPKKTKKTNSRFINLTRLVGLEDRIIYDGDNVDILNRLKIDFENTNRILEKEREKSLKFIIDAINN